MLRSLSRDNEAVSPIISMILLIMIMLVVTAGIMQWATPVIQRAQYEAHYGATQGYFNALDLAIEDVVKGGVNSTREMFVNIGGGELYFGGMENWRISYNETNETGATKTVEWDRNLSCIEHKLASPFGTYITRFENLGVATQAVGERWISNEPMRVERKNIDTPNKTVVCIYLANFTSSGIKGGTAGNYKFYILLNSTNITNLTSTISNLTLNISGEWRETWYSYFLKDYEIANATGNVANYIGWAPKGDCLIYKTAQTKDYLSVANELRYRAVTYNLEIILKIA
ncbi:MAG: hypothetical protein AB1485_03470 [Candidatus Thermoplasmatota archaeon]